MYIATCIQYLVSLTKKLMSMIVAVFGLHVTEKQLCTTHQQHCK